MSEELLDIQENSGQTKKRPVFLTVLCILTFVGSGFGLLGAVVNIFTFKTLGSRTLSNLSNLPNSTPFGDVDFEEMVKYSQYSNMMNILACILCIVGAILMFRLKKSGFYFYLVGAIIATAGAYIATQGFNTGMFASVGVASFIFALIINAAFVVMYGTNLKHLK